MVSQRESYLVKYFRKYFITYFRLDSPSSSHSGSLSDMSSESNGSLSKNDHRSSLDFKLIVDDVKSGQQVFILT